MAAPLESSCLCSNCITAPESNGTLMSVASQTASPNQFRAYVLQTKTGFCLTTESEITMTRDTVHLLFEEVTQLSSEQFEQLGFGKYIDENAGSIAKRIFFSQHNDAPYENIEKVVINLNFPPVHTGNLTDEQKLLMLSLIPRIALQCRTLFPNMSALLSSYNVRVGKEPKCADNHLLPTSNSNDISLYPNLPQRIRVAAYRVKTGEGVVVEGDAITFENDTVSLVFREIIKMQRAEFKERNPWLQGAYQINEQADEDALQGVKHVSLLQSYGNLQIRRIFINLNIPSDQPERDVRMMRYLVPIIGSYCRDLFPQIAYVSESTFHVQYGSNLCHANQHLRPDASMKDIALYPR